MSTIIEMLSRLEEELAKLQVADDKTDHEWRREEELQAHVAVIRLIRPKVLHYRNSGVNYKSIQPPVR
jgi:hypothetical protein